jgi:hypothetical protein
MKKLHFQNTDEFERLFKSKDITITDAIADAINEAYKFQKKTAMGDSIRDLPGILQRARRTRQSNRYLLTTKRS